MEKYMESELKTGSSKTSCQKYSAWVPGDLKPSCFYSVMF